jgi:hypothetical protein
MEARKTGMSKSDRFFLIASLICIFLDVLLSKLYPGEFGPLLSGAFLILVIIALFIILSWLRENTRLKGTWVSEALQLLLMLLLMVVLVSDNLPRVRAWMARVAPLVTRHLRFWEVFFGTLVCAVLAYIFIALQEKHRQACATVEVAAMIVVCAVCVRVIVSQVSAKSISELIASIFGLALAFDHFGKQSREGSKEPHAEGTGERGTASG